jgi:hypothetical protein
MAGKYHMKNQKTSILTVFVLALSAIFCLVIRGQETSLTATASPNVLRVGEQFNLVYTSDEEVSELKLPDIENIELLGGPSQGHSQSVYSVNGKITTSSTYQYTYFLRASKEGKFTINAATAKIKNKAVRSNAITIEVVASGNSTPRSDLGNEPDDSKSPEIRSEDLYVSLIPDKSEVYLGEQIIATIKIYTKVNLSGIDPNFKGPDFRGFFTEPVETPALRNLQRETIGGDIFYTGVLRKVVIIPQKAGEITIQPFEIDVAVRQELKRRSVDPFFDDFAFPDVQETAVNLKSKAVKIVVKPLPANAPKSFTGAVGSFNFTSSLSKTTAGINEPLTLKYTISGKGNIKLINELNLEVPYDLEKYDPVINTHTNSPLSGTKTFEYMIVPKNAGTFSIPPLAFSYFDPSVNQFKTISSQAFTIEVEKGGGDTLVLDLPGVSKEDVKMLNQDIRFIKDEKFSMKPEYYLSDSPLFYSLYALLLALFLFMLWIRSRIIRSNADIVGVRIRRADRYARKRLRKSAELIKLGKNNAFYETLLGAIWGYLSDKLNIPVSTLSRDTAKSALHAKGVDDIVIEDLFSIINECEMARYAQAAGNVTMEKLYRHAIDVISALQQKLKY